MKTLSHLITRFIGTPLMVHQPKFELIVKTLEPRLGLQVDESSFKAIQDENTKRLMAHYTDQGVDRPYAVADGIAIIPIQGVLTKRLSGMAMWSGGCSYEDISSQLNVAMSDSGVQAVMLDIDSPGGEVSGCFDLADEIYSMRGEKPIWAVSNDAALSAAYAIASSASKIYVTRTGAVGSIGVYAAHCSQAEYDKKMGVKFTYVFAGAHKVDGNPHEELSDRAEATIQAEVDREYEMFTSLVARNRSVDQKDIVATKADLLWADSSVPLLADAVGTFDDAMTALSSLSSKPSSRSKAASAVTPIQGESMLTPAELAAKAAEEEEMKNRGKTPPPDDDQDDKDGTTGNKSAKTPVGPVGSAGPTGLTGPVGLAGPTGPTGPVGRSDDDTMAISNLCSLAGVPHKAAEFLIKRDAKGNYLSVGAVSQELNAARLAENPQGGIVNGIDVTQGKKANSFERLASEAARNVNKTAVVSRLYGEGVRKGTTAQQAIAASLEEHQEVYEAYRARHNAGALVKQLQDAGYSLVSA